MIGFGKKHAKMFGKHVASHIGDAAKRGFKDYLKKSALKNIMGDEEIERITDTGISAISQLIK